MQKCLLVTPRIPNQIPKTGGQAVLHGILESYSKYSDLYIICRYNPEETKEIEWVKTKTKVGIFIPKYYSSNQYIIIVEKIISWIKLYRLVRKYSREFKFDFIQIEWVESGFFSFITKNIPVVLDTHDIRYSLIMRKIGSNTNYFLKIYNLLIILPLKYLEIRTINGADYILTKSRSDREFIKKNIKNSSNIFLLTCPVKKELLQNRWNIKKSNSVITFLGNLGRDENNRSVLHLCRDIWPPFHDTNSDYKLFLVGSNPSKEILNIANNDSSILVCGFVDNIVSIFEKTRIFVAPLPVGGGIIVKILDALTYGIPTVTTSYGNQGISAENAREIFVADRPEDFVKQMNLLVRDDDLCLKISANAQNYIRNNFHFDNEVKCIFLKLSEDIGHG